MRGPKDDDSCFSHEQIFLILQEPQDRTVAGVDRLQSQIGVPSMSGRIEGGYRLAAGKFGLPPFAAVQFTASLLDYSERVVSGLGYLH